MKIATSLRQIDSDDNRAIVVSYLSGDLLHADFTHSLVQLSMFEILNGRHLGTSNIKTTNIELGRIRQVAEAIRRNCSHILFVDSDMTFPRDTLTRLLAHNVPIVGTTYSQRRSPRMLLHERFDETTDVESSARKFEVKSLGFGCVLVNIEVFNEIPRPWFENLFIEGLDPFGVDRMRSEDRTFCDKARLAGINIWCDPHLSEEIGHIGTFEFKLEHAEVPFSYR